MSARVLKVTISLIVQGSSLGNYTLEWIDTFYRFMNGKSARDLVGRPKAKEWPTMKVLFPSLDTVKKSELGLEVSLTSRK